MSDSLVLKDTRQNDLDSLPSAIDFFDELISQKRDTPVVEIDDDDYMNYNNHDDEQPSIERKGKRKATEDIIPAKEKKRLEVEERKQQRANIAEAKRIQKEQNALEKKRLREQKQLEKEKATLLEKENRLRLDRTQILQEMLIDIHPTFLQSKQGQLLEASLKAKEAHLRDLTAYETLPNYTIGWRRQCQSEWDQGSQAFLPLEKVKIIKEPVILIFLDALAFIQHLQEDTLDQLVSSLEKPGRQTMMLIEGLDGYYKKKMIMTRRAFASQVLQTDNRPRKQTNSTNQVIAEGPCKEEVEEALAYLQLMRDVMLVTTKDAQDTVSWIESLTIDLGLGRYKSKNLNTTFKVSKCGHNAHDTFYKMLQEVQLCTPAIAGSIMKHYPTVQSLHHAYRSTHSASEAEMMLADLEVERSALQTRDRKINRVMSRKMHTIFTGQDAEQIIY
ncbi:hypothetical protein BD560DRAFT_210508 [Blakeslea trispora]|nr:hypothetical protein BD560DRAFT_210508 [Blakeslea trispora]